MNHQIWPVRTQCRVLAVSTSAYYAWRKRPESARARYDAVPLVRIRQCHVDPGGTYGAPRIRAALENHGHHVSTKRLARLMHVAGLCGETRRTRVMTTTPGSERAVPDRVERDFSATAADQL